MIIIYSSSLARVLITGLIFVVDPQSQAPAVRERPGVIEATIYHILNEEMGQIALNAIEKCTHIAA
jgi:hypothetical protein